MSTQLHTTSCLMTGCDHPSRSCGMCVKHYTRWRRHGNPLIRKFGGVTKHGCTGTPEYHSWDHMLQRCLNPNNERFSDYGGCGIKVCKRWTKFENFLADMGKRPVGTSLDRFPDKYGDYKPSNCRWATASEQQNNRRPNRKRVS